MKITNVVAVALVSAMPMLAMAQIKIGVTVSSTGPAASLGIPERNAVALMPREIAGQKVEYIVLDDASDTTTARKNTEKLVTEEKVDAIIGSSTTPNALGMIEVAARYQTPMIALAASQRIIEPMDAQRRWVFKTPFGDSHMAFNAVKHMASRGVKTLAYIGFNDAYGEGWYQELQKFAELQKIRIVANEVYNRTDTSVTAQVLKTVAANPDAVLIGATGTPSVLPQSALVERGYKGLIYQTHGVLNNDFLRVGGKAVQGALIPAAAVLVAEELPDSHPAKKPGVDFKRRYEAAHGANSLTTFAANAWDAHSLIANAVPAALRAGKPGTEQFRVALRDAIEKTNGLATTHGVINMSEKDHVGLPFDAPVILTVQGGGWSLAK